MEKKRHKWSAVLICIIDCQSFEKKKSLLHFLSTLFVGANCQAIIVQLLVSAVLIISSASENSCQTAQLWSLKWSDIITAAGPENSISFTILPLTEGWRSGPDRNGRMVSGNDMKSKGNRGHLQSHLSIPASPIQQRIVPLTAFVTDGKLLGIPSHCPDVRYGERPQGRESDKWDSIWIRETVGSLYHNTIFNRKMSFCYSFMIHLGDSTIYL